MLKRTLIVLAVLAVPSFAGIRVNRTPNRVEINGVTYGTSWTISSPTLSSDSGYLSYDITGKSLKVYYSRKQGPHTTWTFVERKRYVDEVAGKESKGDEHRKFGYSLQVRASAGPFAGWFLGRVDGELVLVKNPRQAATIVMVVRESYMEHK